MDNKRNNIIIAYAYHFTCIISCFLFMKYSANTLFDFIFTTNIIYFLYYTYLNIKGYADWKLLRHFAIGTTIELLLNYFKIIPEDILLITLQYGNMTQPEPSVIRGLTQIFYEILLVLHLLILFVVTLIFSLLNKRKASKEENNKNVEK